MKTQPEVKKRPVNPARTVMHEEEFRVGVTDTSLAIEKTADGRYALTFYSTEGDQYIEVPIARRENADALRNKLKALAQAIFE